MRWFEIDVFLFSCANLCWERAAPSSFRREAQEQGCRARLVSIGFQPMHRFVESLHAVDRTRPFCTLCRFCLVGWETVFSKSRRHPSRSQRVGQGQRKVSNSAVLLCSTPEILSEDQLLRAFNSIDTACGCLLFTGYCPGFAT